MRDIACLLFVTTLPLFAGEVRRAASLDTTVDAPSIGYVVYHAPLELRPILGVPGAARLGDPIPLPEGVINVLVAPDHRSAILETESAVGVWTLDSSNPVVWFEAVSKVGITFSPSGSAAALRDGRTVRLMTGLPAAPSIARSVEIPAGVTRMAVSDDGALLLAAVGNELWRIDAVQASLLPSIGDAEVRAVAFAPGSHEAVACAGPAAWKIVESAYLPLVSAEPDAPDWTFAAVAANGVLLASAQKVLRVGNDQTRQYFDIPVAAERLERLAATRFLYAASRGEPAWFLLASDERIDSYFVPAAVPSVVEGVEQ
jgi:hypothetical protein